MPVGATASIRCVARPAIASVDSSKARCADPLARSIETIMATPSATPKMNNTYWKGRRLMRRHASRHKGWLEMVGCVSKLSCSFKPQPPGFYLLG